MVFTVSIIFLLDQAKTWKSGEIWFCMLVCIYESIKGKKKKKKKEKKIQSARPGFTSYEVKEINI